MRYTPRAGAQPDAAAPKADAGPDDAVQEEADEEDTCGFCIFMKAGGCREAFVVRYSWTATATFKLNFDTNVPKGLKMPIGMERLRRPRTREWRRFH